MTGNGGLPPYYFRVKENGALVFRVDTENRQRRLDLDQIATVNINNGQVKPQGGTELTAEDEAAIADWMAARTAELEARDMDDIRRAIDHLNLTAHWAQAKATDEQLDAVTDRLLLAMHDLRSVLVKKRADRLPDS
jgi:phage terminase Nu1 subunit (DNA packaging protein)